MTALPVWKGVKGLRNIDPPEDTFPTLDECRRLARRAPAQFRPLVEATFQTGAAYGELIALQVKDYRADSGHVVVFDSKPRNRALPLTPDGMALFDELTAGRKGDEYIFTRKGLPWKKSEQKRPMTEANRLAKISPPITLTKLRKAYGSLLLNAGVSLDVVAKAMGHSDTRITKRHYSRLLQGTIDDQIRAALPSLDQRRKGRG
jgi:integrase